MPTLNRPLMAFDKCFSSLTLSEMYQVTRCYKKHITLAAFLFPVKSLGVAPCLQVFFGDSSHAATAKGAGALAGCDDFARGCYSNGRPLACEGAATTAWRVLAGGRFWPSWDDYSIVNASTFLDEFGWEIGLNWAEIYQLDFGETTEMHRVSKLGLVLVFGPWRLSKLLKLCRKSPEDLKLVHLAGGQSGAKRWPRGANWCTQWGCTSWGCTDWGCNWCNGWECPWGEQWSIRGEVLTSPERCSTPGRCFGPRWACERRRLGSHPLFTVLALLALICHLSWAAAGGRVGLPCLEYQLQWLDMVQDIGGCVCQLSQPGGLLAPTPSGPVPSAGGFWRSGGSALGGPVSPMLWALLP